MQGVFSSISFHCIIFLACVFLSVQCSQPTSEDGRMIYPLKLWYEVNETLLVRCSGHSYQSVTSACSASGTWIPPPTCVSTTICPGFLSCPISSLASHWSDFTAAFHYNGAGLVEGWGGWGGGDAQHVGRCSGVSCPLSLFWFF